MQWLLAVPAAVKVGCAFAAILLLNSLGVPLGLAVVSCALLLGLWSGIGVAALQFQLSSILGAENLLLLVLVVLLLFFSESLGASGRIDRTITLLRARLNRPRALLAGLPALIGLLPMPGGALVSAPMVASMDTENSLEATRKVAVNYWFRHIWEYWWPLYPGVVLAIQYSGLPMVVFYAIQIPFTAAAIFGGWLFILRRADARLQTVDASARVHPPGGTAIVPIAALVATTVLGAAIGTRLNLGSTQANLAAMLLGLAIALTLVFARAPKAFLRSAHVLRSPKIWMLVLVVAGVQMFSAALTCPLDAGGSTLVSRMGKDFLDAGIPIVAVMMVMPMVAGLVTGIAVGFVGVSFPLIFGLLPEGAPLSTVAATTSFAYAFGYMGMMLSPIHICFVVTNEYFNTRLARAYRYVLGPAAVILLTSLALAGLYYTVL
jgi:integral membrane protein (TIGR00529 family)